MARVTVARTTCRPGGRRQYLPRPRRRSGRAWCGGKPGEVLRIDIATATVRHYCRDHEPDETRDAPNGLGQ